MELSYVAHSERCALLLDSDGVCRWVVPKVAADDELVTAARRCIGAQFVTCLDRSAPGLLANEPRVGTNMLFAVVTDGRVSLVRFGPIQSFEKLTIQEQPKSDDTQADVASSLTATPRALESTLELQIDVDVSSALTRAPQLTLELDLEDDEDDEDDDEPTVHRPSGVQIRAHVALMDPFDDDVTTPVTLEEIAATYARSAS